MPIEPVIVGVPSQESIVRPVTCEVIPTVKVDVDAAAAADPLAAGVSEILPAKLVKAIPELPSAHELAPESTESDQLLVPL